MIQIVQFNFLPQIL